MDIDLAAHSPAQHVLPTYKVSSWRNKDEVVKWRTDT